MNLYKSLFKSKIPKFAAIRFFLAKIILGDLKFAHNIDYYPNIDQPCIEVQSNAIALIYECTFSLTLAKGVEIPFEALTDGSVENVASE